MSHKYLPHWIRRETASPLWRPLEVAIEEGRVNAIEQLVLRVDHGIARRYGGWAPYRERLNSPFVPGDIDNPYDALRDSIPLRRPRP